MAGGLSDRSDGAKKSTPASQAAKTGAAGQLRALPANSLLDALSVRLNGPKAGAIEMVLNLAFTDTGETFAVTVENAVLHQWAGAMAGAPTVSLTRRALTDLVIGQTSIEAAMATGSLTLTEGAGTPEILLGLLDRFDFCFEIVTP